MDGLDGNSLNVRRAGLEVCDRPVILECGSNDGSETLSFLSRWPDARAFCFEPDGCGERGAEGEVEQEHWEVEPAMGGDAHGGSDWLDHAELYLSCDNRTDELRLLGNGVVPATAETAFRVLLAEMWEKSLSVTSGL